MSDFKNILSKACEAARSNLKSAQSKMKLRYDENAQDGNFEPGDKVLALLPIPGKPLQARYYGPYTVDKKLCDVNYTVNTPGRRKQKQLCHINMLKSTVLGIVLLLYPTQTLFVGGILFSRCPSVRASVRPSVRNVLFP